MSMEFGDDAPAASPGFGGINKRTLLIGAAILGGGVGLVLLISRMNSGAGDETTEQSDTPRASINDLAYQNLATQLLGMRGDTSVWQADLLDKLNANQEDTSSQLAENQAAAQSWYQNLWRAIGGVANNQEASAATPQLAAHIYLQNRATTLFQQGVDTAKVNEFVNTGLADIRNWQGGDPASLMGPITQRFDAIRPAPPAQSGAGGLMMRDAILAAFDGGMGDAAEARRRMSAGPVRRLVA